MRIPWFELKICLIKPLDDKGVYNPREAEILDYICVSLYENPVLFLASLANAISLLLNRNNIFGED